jgi:hypothetical protein
MEFWLEMFSTTTGLLSLFVIVFMLGMGAFFVTWFLKKSKRPPGGD